MSYYPALLCANFKELEEASQQTGSTRLTVVLSALEYASVDGVISQSKEWLQNLFGFGRDALDRALSRLSSFHFIKKTIDGIQRYGRICIKIIKGVGTIINHRKLQLMDSYTGNTISSLILSYLAFRLNPEKNSKIIEVEGSLYTRLAKGYLTRMLKKCKRTINAHIARLISKGIVIKQTLYRNGKRCTYYTINRETYEAIQKEWLAIKRAKAGFCNAAPSEPNYIDNNTLGILKPNITREHPQEKHPLPEQIAQGDIIIFNSDDFLSKRDNAYLIAAFNRTITNYGLRITNPSRILDEIKYAVITCQNTESFEHSVNRMMWLLRGGRWETPRGYERYVTKGEKLKMRASITESATINQPTGMLGSLMQGFKRYFKPREKQEMVNYGEGKQRNEWEVVKDGETRQTVKIKGTSIELFNAPMSQDDYAETPLQRKIREDAEKLAPYQDELDLLPIDRRLARMNEILASS